MVWLEINVGTFDEVEHGSPERLKTAVSQHITEYTQFELSSKFLDVSLVAVFHAVSQQVKVLPEKLEFDFWQLLYGRDLLLFVSEVK